MPSSDLIPLGIIVVLTIGILIAAFSFARRMTMQYTAPLERIADTQEEIAQQLRRQSPKE